MLDYITVLGFIIFLVLLILVACRLVMDFPGIVEGDISQVLREYGIGKEQPVEEVIDTERRETESSDCKQNKSLMTKMSNKPNIHKIHGSEDIKVSKSVKISVRFARLYNRQVLQKELSQECLSWVG